MTTPLLLSLIVAVAENGVIGRNNKIPWYLSEDLKYFKRTTMGKPVVMGRLTWDSIGRPLPGRQNIVVSRNSQLSLEGAKTVPDLSAALEIVKALQAIDGTEEMMIIGGRQIYQMALPLIQRMYITEIHAQVEGDALFPDWDPSQWRERSREAHWAVEPNPYDYSFVVYDRR